jgi:hypothetical protein
MPEETAMPLPFQILPLMGKNRHVIRRYSQTVWSGEKVADRDDRGPSEC